MGRRMIPYCGPFEGLRCIGEDGCSINQCARADLRDSAPWDSCCNLTYPHSHGKGGPIDSLIEASSLGTPEAKAARASVTDEQAAKVIARADQIEAEQGIRCKHCRKPIKERPPKWYDGRHGGPAWIHEGGGVLCYDVMAEPWEAPSAPVSDQPAGGRQPAKLIPDPAAAVRRGLTARCPDVRWAVLHTFPSLNRYSRPSKKLDRNGCNLTMDIHQYAPLEHWHSRDQSPTCKHRGITNPAVTR